MTASAAGVYCYLFVLETNLGELDSPLLSGTFLLSGQVVKVVIVTDLSPSSGETLRMFPL